MNKQLKVLYFASLGEALRCDEELVALDTQVKTVADLKGVLASRGENWAKLLSEPSLRCAVDHTISRDDTLLANAEEIAFFPPVTGG